MRPARFVSMLGLMALATVFLFPAIPAGAVHGGDTLVSVGSPTGPFAQNKQNEPAVAIDAAHPGIVAAGSNDEIDLEACNAGPGTDCPFTAGVGVSGIYFSFNSGDSWTQPTYTGWSARNCLGAPDPSVTTDTCQPEVGPIGTLPNYFENRLVSNGDPALAFGPIPGPNGFDWSNGSRMYYANLASNFGPAPTFKGSEAVYVSRIDGAPALTPAIVSDQSSWKDPVLVSKQNSALFSDKEQIWADNAESSPFFGNVYICNVAFRSMASAPEPVIFSKSADGGDSWQNKQISEATNTNQTGGRQGCAVRSNSKGDIFVFWVGTDIQTRQTVMFFRVSTNGGGTFGKKQIATFASDVGLFDPNTGRFSFDGVGGARTSTFPSIDIANGAPSGAGATDEIVLSWPNGPTPSDAAPGPNEQALIKWSIDNGQTWSDALSGSLASDRPDFPAIAISPDGTDAYLVYDNFLQPWQSTTADPRLMQGVVRHADVDPVTGAIGSFADLFRGAVGDARGSSQNGLTAEFLGDYNYVAATNDFSAAVWNDVRHAADCPDIDTYRQSIADGTPGPRPAPNTDCPFTFGNSDIFGGSYADPSP